MTAQTRLAIVEDEDETAEIEAGHVWRAELWSALRSFVSTYTYKGLTGYEACATHLNRRWEPCGRPVTAAALSAALRDAERNNFRAEWLDWFAARSEDVARVMARRVKPTKTVEQMLEDVIAEMREELSHKSVERILRRARAR
jgi:hypothetical protein